MKVSIDEHQYDLEVETDDFCDYIGFRSKSSDFGHSMANTALTWNWIEGGYSYMNHTALVPDFHARL
jgi:hypothetical protein